jgi:hypothetical protein
MQDNYYASMFVEEFLNKYFTANGDMLEFPSDEQLEDMYDQLLREYYETQIQDSDVNTQQRFNNLLWLILIGSLYRRYPYYRRCRGRRCRPRPRPRPRPYGYNTKDLMGQIKDQLKEK